MYLNDLKKFGASLVRACLLVMLAVTAAGIHGQTQVGQESTLYTGARLILGDRQVYRCR